MKVTNTKEERKVKLLEVDASRFDSFFDYYVFLHLNEKVIVMHIIGMIVGFSCLFLAIYKMSIVYLILFLITLNGFPHGSHIVLDGIVSPATKASFGMSIYHAIKLNLIYMFGRFSKLEKDFLEKYPFAMEAYSNS